MASATGVPERVVGNGGVAHHHAETEPLLGRPGDVAQADGGSFIKNLYIGEPYPAVALRQSSLTPNLP
jgi:hypothetical protein